MQTIVSLFLSYISLGHALFQGKLVDENPAKNIIIVLCLGQKIMVWINLTLSLNNLMQRKRHYLLLLLTTYYGARTTRDTQQTSTSSTLFREINQKMCEVHFFKCATCGQRWEAHKKLASCECFDPVVRCPESLVMYVGTVKKPEKGECEECKNVREVLESLEEGGSLGGGDDGDNDDAAGRYQYQGQ